MGRALILSALVLSAVFSPTPLLAHHNVAQMYDAEKPVPLNGTVTAILWRNPHVFVFVDVKDESGSVVNWKVEWLSASPARSKTIASACARRCRTK
jgi:uncharacterized protein DUF6152